MSQLFDDMDIKARSGEFEVDVSGLSTGGDKFLAALFNETSKTKRGQIMEYYVDEQAVTTAANKIRKPRTAMQLMYALQPNVRTAQEGTPAYQYAATAHQLLIRSPYYSDADVRDLKANWTTEACKLIFLLFGGVSNDQLCSGKRW